MSKKVERKTVALDKILGDLERQIDGKAAAARTCSRYMYCV
ncbi:hypothetical protein [Stackebrandtia soli]